MPLTLNDFKPFFKSYTGTLEFIPNETIKADKIVLWDDTELIGKATIYINDARIGYHNFKVREQKRTQQCNNKYNSVRTNNGFVKVKTVVLPGITFPGGLTPTAASSDSINLPGGYDFTVKETNKRKINARDIVLLDGFVELKTSVFYGNFPPINNNPVDKPVIPVALMSALDSLITAKFLQDLNSKIVWRRYVTSGRTLVIFPDENKLLISQGHFEGYVTNFSIVNVITTDGQTIPMLRGYFDGYAIYNDVKINIAWNMLYDNNNINDVHMYVQDPYTIALVTIPGNFEFTGDANGSRNFIYPLTSVDILGGKAVNNAENGHVILSYTKDGAFIINAEQFYFKNYMIDLKDNKLRFDQGVWTSQLVDKISCKNIYYTDNVTIEAKIENSVTLINISDNIIHFGKYFSTQIPISFPSTEELYLTTPGSLNTSVHDFTLQYDSLHLFVDPAVGYPTMDVTGTFNFDSLFKFEDISKFRITYADSTFSFVFDPIRKVYLGEAQQSYIDNVKVIRIDNMFDFLGVLTAGITIYGGEGLINDVYSQPIVTLNVASTSNLSTAYTFASARIQGGTMEYDSGTVRNDSDVLNIYYGDERYTKLPGEAYKIPFLTIS